MGEREPIGDEENQGGLPPAYWWADGPDGANLYERYGWVATVTPTSVKITPQSPQGPEIIGRCRGIEQGKRMVRQWGVG